MQLTSHEVRYIPQFLNFSRSLQHARKWGWAIKNLHDIPFSAIKKEFVGLFATLPPMSPLTQARTRGRPTHHLHIHSSLSIKKMRRKVLLMNLHFEISRVHLAPFLSRVLTRLVSILYLGTHQGKIVKAYNIS